MTHKPDAIAKVAFVHAALVAAGLSEDAALLATPVALRTALDAGLYSGNQPLYQRALNYAHYLRQGGVPLDAAT